MSEPASNDQMAQMQGTIERQTEEIARLTQRLDDERFAEDVRRALTLAAATGTIAAPVSHGRLLEMIVTTAAQVISAQAASLMLVDEAAQDLVFEVALGQKAEEVRKFHVPLGHGIAGLVAVTGQPMAVANASQDARQASDIATQIGYKPQSILCVPLFLEDRVIGVLELFDKLDALNTITTFSASDMETLGHFANQAAVAIELSRTQNNLAGLLAQTLSSSPTSQTAPERAQNFVAGLEDDAAYRRSLELARFVHEIASRGEEESAACADILRGFAEYLRVKSNRDDFSNSGEAVI